MRLARTVIGMVHLLPLPGSPRWAGSMDAVAERALADARALAEAGADALLLENFGDMPFTAGRVEAVTVAAMSVAAAAVRGALPAVPLGINVLRNDTRSALAVAAACGASFVRANVLAGAAITDQGLVQSDAYGVLRDRRRLETGIAIFADVHSKHAVPLGGVDLEHEARDVAGRALADALIVTGRATGEAAPREALVRVRAAVPGTPLLVGSGVTAESAAALLEVADALIVGTAVKRDGRVENPVDPARARRLVEAVRRG